jgi:enoyl-CoA hydratase
MASNFLLEKTGRVATLTFNRPEKRHPVNEESLLEMEGILHQVRDDKNVRVMILTGSGNTFCGGADLSQIRGITDERERDRIFAPIRKQRLRLASRVVPLLVGLEQITIAAVNGYAAGGGWLFTLACDLRIAAEEAQFWFPEVDLGAPLNSVVTALLAAEVGPAMVKEIGLTCRRYSAAELLQMRMLNQVVKKEELLPAARKLAESIAAKNSIAVMASKRIANAMALRNPLVLPDLVLDRE